MLYTRCQKVNFEGYFGPKIWSPKKVLTILLTTFLGTPYKCTTITFVTQKKIYGVPSHIPRHHAPPCPPDEGKGLHSSALPGWHPLHIWTGVALFLKVPLSTTPITSIVSFSPWHHQWWSIIIITTRIATKDNWSSQVPSWLSPSGTSCLCREDRQLCGEECLCFVMPVFMFVFVFLFIVSIV